jgi:hypothetical protein
VFLQEISSQPSCKRSFLNTNRVVARSKREFQQFLCPQCSLFPGISHFNGLRWFYGYPKYERDGCLLSQPFLLVPIPIRKGLIYNYNKVFMLLIPRCSASSPMLPIGTSRVGLTCNTEPIGVTFRSILESKIEASEAASIGDTRQKELFYIPNFTFNKRRFISISFFLFFIPNPVCLSRKTENAK